MRRLGFGSLSGLFLLILGVGHAQAARDEITIGTGGVSGVYYPTGKAICTALNKRTRHHGIHCSAVSTEGSVENALKVRSGAYDFGIVQSDVQYYALKGYGPFKKHGADKTLRAVLSFFPETFTIVARADAGIRTLNDLQGKRVNIGNPGSGQRTSMDIVMHMKGWTKSDFAVASELVSAQQSAALCNNEIDAFVFTAGHPNASIKQAADACKTVLVSVKDASIQNLIQKYPYFSPVIIPGNTYTGTGWSTPSFGVMATLVTSESTPDDVVYAVTQAIFRDFTDFKFSHPALFKLKPEEMISVGQTVPYHSGAVRYFKQMGYEPKVPKVRKAPKR